EPPTTQAARLQKCTKQVRRAGLAVGTRDAADWQRPRGMTVEGRRQVDQGAPGVRNAYPARAYVTVGLLGSDRRRTLCQRLRYEREAIALEARDGDEQLARLQPARVIGDTVDPCPRIAPDERRPRCLGNEVAQVSRRGDGREV